MPVFYFHLRDAREARDTSGTELSGIQEAKAEAISRARDLFAARDEAAWAGRDWEQTVMDEAGRLVLRLTVRAVPPAVP